MRLIAVLAVAHFLLAAVAIVLALWRRRGFLGTLAWFFVVAAVPIWGSLAYLLLANPRVRRATLRRREAADRVQKAAPACVAPAIRNVQPLAPQPTLQALRAAALRGVDVRVMVPARSDIPFMTRAIRSYYPALLEAGVRLFEYQPTMLHAKTAVVDGLIALVGSANLDIRSFALNFEAGALVVDPGFAGELEERFLEDARSATEVTKAWLEGRGVLSAVGDGAPQLLSPLL